MGRRKTSTAAAAESTVKLSDEVVQLETLSADAQLTITLALETYQKAKVEADAAKETMEMAAAEIKASLETEGRAKIRAGELPICIVRGTSSKLDKVRFVELGGSLATLENATITKPKKAYVRIGAEKERNEDES